MMTAEEARNKAAEHLKYDMTGIYNHFEYEINEAVNNGCYSCNINIDGCDKPWEQIYYERMLIERYFTNFGYTVECLGYNRACMWDEYKISWE